MNYSNLSSLLLLLFVEYIGILLSVIADLISGLRKARRNGEQCTSGGLRRTVAKLSSYYLAIFSLTIVDIIAVAAIHVLGVVGGQVIPAFPYLTTLGSISLVLIEAKSIAENSPHSTSIFDALRLIQTLLKKR